MVLCGPEVGKSWVNCQALMGQTSSGLRLMWVNYRGFMGGKSLIHGSNLGSVEGPPGQLLRARPPIAHNDQRGGSNVV